MMITGSTTLEVGSVTPATDYIAHFLGTMSWKNAYGNNWYPLGLTGTATIHQTVPGYCYWRTMTPRSPRVSVQRVDTIVPAVTTWEWRDLAGYHTVDNPVGTPLWFFFIGEPQGENQGLISAVCAHKVGGLTPIGHYTIGGDWGIIVPSYEGAASGLVNTCAEPFYVGPVI